MTLLNEFSGMNIVIASYMYEISVLTSIKNKRTIVQATIFMKKRQN